MEISNTINFLTIIPARGGSKGIPKKNIKRLNGKPLIEYTIASAKLSRHIKKLIVSTDDDEIISICKKLDVEVPFKRPSELAQDDTGSLEVVQHAVAFFEDQNVFFDAVILLQPTTPFREDGFIDKAIESFVNNKSDSLVSVLPVPHQFNPHWVFEPNDHNYLQVATGETEIITRRQDLPKAYFRDGSVYITKTEVIKKGSLYGNKTSFIESNPEFHVNIDTLDDWVKAEQILRQINI